MRILDRQALRQMLRSAFSVFDGPLTLVIFLIVTIGLMTLYSASLGSEARMKVQIRNIAIALVVMYAFACIPPQTLMRFAVPLYTIGITLLIAVLLFGILKKGARRWLYVGLTIQPSEIMKIAVPMMLAWFFHMREGIVRWQESLIAAVLLAIPATLILKQPDLGTTLLVVGTGCYVIFLAGLSWKIIAGLIVSGLASLPFLWSMLHGYQKQRILTLIDPSTDPLGKGFHIIQSTIAVGSGGFFGKGWLHGTQTHLQFLPERSTDFIFAVYSEEFGLVGNLILLALYLLLIGRGLYIASRAPTIFTRLLAGAISLMFFNYAFVNMGMVSGILPVVGAPLPFMSYGGTAMVTLGLGAGILMSIQRYQKVLRDHSDWH